MGEHIELFLSLALGVEQSLDILAHLLSAVGREHAAQLSLSLGQWLGG